MLFINLQALSTSLALIGVLPVVLAGTPRPRFQRRQNDATASSNPTGVATICSLSASCGGSIVSTSRNATSALSSSTLSSNSVTVPTGNLTLGYTTPSSESTRASISSLTANFTATNTESGRLSMNSATSNYTATNTRSAAVSMNSSTSNYTATNTATNTMSARVSMNSSTSNYTASNTKSATSQSSKINATSTMTSATAGTSISCQDSDYWAPTVQNWKEEDVDAKLSSWALNLVPNPPTAIPKGSYPTQLPQIFTGFGNTSHYGDVIGVPGQLMSIANSGMDVSCVLVEGPNGQCPPVTVPEACGNMPRWAYLAWQAIYNMFSIHVQINAVILDSTAFQLGQAPEIVSTFAPQEDSEKGLEIFLTVLGSIVTVIGILIPLGAVGAAATLEMDNAAVSAAAAEGGIAGRIGVDAGDDAGSAGGSAAGSEDPDAILPVSPGQPNINPGGSTPEGVSTDPPPSAGDGKTPVTVKPQGEAPQVEDPTFIGNVGWVAPGTMTSMSNTIWQESKAVTNPDAKSNLNSQAVVDYLGNQSAVLTQYNNALLFNTDNASINNLLSVLAGGSFIQTAWSQAVFETALSADVISRQINTAWQSQSIGGTYVSYTQLHDNQNGTICNGTHVGVRSTQVCADTGVYYLNVLNLKKLSPSLVGPPGFSSLAQYGIMPWWPVSASATAYRLLNPNGNVVPPQITTTDDSIFAKYMSQFASSDPYGLLSTIGQVPGTWSFPVCDQGGNFWGVDWTNKGGYTTSNKWYNPMPCACGYQGSGTKAFYEALGASRGSLYWVSAQCEANLQYVDPNLALTAANIGWNQISGGPPAKSIDYGQGYTVAVPTNMPDPCYMGTTGCGAPGKAPSLRPPR